MTLEIKQGGKGRAKRGNSDFLVGPDQNVGNNFLVDFACNVDFKPQSQL